MKIQIKQKSSVIVLAALCVWSTQAVAIQGTDAIFNCKVFSDDGTANAKKYYLRENSQRDKQGTLTYTTDAALATKFTFSRKDSWKNDTGGTAYYMTGGKQGGCVGLNSLFTPEVGTTVTTNWPCSATTTKRLVIDNTGVTTDFVIRLESSSKYWFDGWGGLVNGATIKLNTPQNNGNFGNNQKFSTSGCKTAKNGSNRPNGGT